MQIETQRASQRGAHQLRGLRQRGARGEDAEERHRRRGPTPRAQTFRNFSFVSGVILETQAAREHATDRWDGSEMYQVFLAARLIAAGGALLYIDASAVRKDIQFRASVSTATRRVHLCDRARS